MNEIIYLLSTETIILLTHLQNERSIGLCLTDLTQSVRTGDIYQGHVQYLERTRAWIDIGEARPALLKNPPLSCKVGNYVIVKIERPPTFSFQGKKGAQISLVPASLNGAENLSEGEELERGKNSKKKGKLACAPYEWRDYLTKLTSTPYVITNSSALFFELKKYFPFLKVQLKSDIEVPSEIILEWESLLQKEKEIPGGGFIIIEETEALTAIDVNTTGLYQNQSVTFKRAQDWLNFNLRAASLIQKYIQNQDLAGIIIIDFPSIKRKKDQYQIFECFKKLKDTRQQILGFTRAGLFEITRQKTNDSLSCRYKDLKKRRADELPY